MKILQQKHYEEMVQELWDQTAKIYFLIDTHNLWSEDGAYCFPDGLILHKDDPYNKDYK